MKLQISKNKYQIIFNNQFSIIVWNFEFIDWFLFVVWNLIIVFLKGLFNKEFKYVFN
jgi:hypothetical protein